MPILSIHASDFETITASAPSPVLLDFWANWCTPCKMLAPVLTELSEIRPELLIGKINVEEEPELASRFRILSIPTLLVFQNGETKKRISGVHTKAEILSLLAT